MGDHGEQLAAPLVQAVRHVRKKEQFNESVSHAHTRTRKHTRDQQVPPEEDGREPGPHGMSRCCCIGGHLFHSC